MKRTQIIELFCNIKATWVSFASIVMFVALGVGLYSGLCWTGENIQKATDSAYKQGNLHAFEMAFPYGFTDDDINAIRNVEGVDDVEPGYASAQTIELDGKTYSTTVRSLTSGIDTLKVEDGTLPDANDEIAINELFAQAHGLQVGDAIEFASDVDESAESPDADGMKYLNGRTYTITALVTSPAYLARNTSYYGMSATGGSIDFLAYVPEGAFDRSAFNDAYVTLEVSSSALDGLSLYSDEYKQASDQIKARIEEVGAARADARYNQIIDSAQAQIDEGQARLDAARQQLDDGAQKLSDAQGEVDATTRKLEDAQLELNVTTKMLASQDSMTLEALNQVAAQIDRYERVYQNARANVESKIAQVDILNGEAEGMKKFSDSVHASFDKLSKAFAENDANDPNAYDTLDAACQEFHTEMNDAVETLKRDAPKTYEQNKTAFDVLLTASENMSPLVYATLQPQIEQAIGIVDSISNTAESASKMAQETADDANAQMNAVKVSLDEVRAMYAQKRADYQAQMASARGQVADGQAKVDSGREQLADAQSQIDAKKTELESAQDEYDAGVAKLENARDQVSQTTSMSWIVTSAYYNGTAQITNEMVNILFRLRFSMASLFVIVGLLVCYSAVSRIVHEQITQTGTKKAIGFRSSEITLSYLMYTGIAVVLGALLGIAVGMAIVEPILIPTMNQCVIGNPAPMFGLGDFLTVSGIDFALILLATWLACRGVLKRNAIDLLQGERPPSNRTRFYERWRVWRRLGLLTQTVVNNCVNDKRRVLGTLVGVAGCTALIVSAITLNDNVNASFNKQLTDIYTFDAVVYCNPDENAESDANATDANGAGAQNAKNVNAAAGDANAADNADASVSSNDAAASNSETAPSVGAYLDKEGLAHAAVQRKTFALNEPDGQQGVARLYTPADPDAFGQLFHLKTFDAPAGTGVLEGAWVCSSYANCFGAKVGDTIQLENSAGQKFDIPIAGFFEYYSSVSAVVLSPSAYERIMGSNVVYNAYLVDARDLDQEQFQADLAENTSDFTSYSNEASSIRTMSAMFNRLSFTMVAIYIALSALMAVIVLLNLNVMFIEEKKRELIVLMINGYSQRDAKRYIYRDTIVMTAVGIVLGCALGCAMGYFSVASLENATLCMLKTPSLVACLAGAVLCALFSAIVTAISLRRISKFSLTDINRF